jgi:hypothetical protein
MKVAFSDLEAFNGTNWLAGSFPQMPFPVYDHCFTKINDSAFISIGGLNLVSGNAGKSTNRLKHFPVFKPRFFHDACVCPSTP